MKSNRLGYIDTARGIAAFSVMIFHSILTLGEKSKSLGELSIFFKDTFDLGKISVIVFFIISGLVVPLSMNGNDKVITIKKFIISRFFRLYPVYWFSAILGYLILGRFNLFELFVNFTMLQQFFGIQNILGLYWTLQIELIFYLLVVIVFAIGKLQNFKFLFYLALSFLFVAVGVAFIRGLYAIKLPLALPLALSLMFFGSVYKCKLIDHNYQIRKFISAYILSYFLIIPVICIFGYNLDLGRGENWIKYTITYYSGLVLFITITKTKSNTTITEYLGKISYSIYLFHPIFIYLVITYTNLTWYYSLVIISTLTLIFSHFTFKFIERSSIQLGKKINKMHNLG